MIELFEKMIKVDLKEIIDYRYDWIIIKELKQKEKENSLVSDDNNINNISKDRINISTFNNVNNTTIGFKEIGEEIKKNVDNVEINLINNSQNININISININNNNNNNINNDNIIEKEKKEKKDKKDKKISKNKKKEKKEKKNNENEENDDEINYYEGIIKEYKTKEITDKNVKNEQNDTNKKLCCLVF